MLIPIESKQILFCSYNEDDHVLYLHYHTGQVVPHCIVGREQFQALLDAPNRYDALIQLAGGDAESMPSLM